MKSYLYFDIVTSYPLRIQKENKYVQLNLETILSKACELYAKLLKVKQRNIILTPCPYYSIFELILSAYTHFDQSIFICRGKYDNTVSFFENFSALGYNVRIKLGYGSHAAEEESLEEIRKGNNISFMPHVYPENGFKSDLGLVYDVCKAYNNILIVDATYSIGAIKINTNRLDVLCAESNHWLMSPPAAGVIYVSDKIIKQMTPKFIKLYIDRNPTPSYFTWLHPYLAMYDALNKSLSSILEEGIDNIEKRVLSLTQWIIDDLGINPKIKILTPSSKRRRAGIVAFSGEFDASKLQKYLTKKKIIISRENRNLIISVHYRHTEEEIEKLILTIREGLRQI